MYTTNNNKFERFNRFFFIQPTEVMSQQGSVMNTNILTAATSFGFHERFICKSKKNKLDKT
jgi:hypothetical protein